LERFCRQRALDDILIESPIVEIRHPHSTYQYSDPRQILKLGVRPVEDHMKFVAGHFIQMTESVKDTSLRGDVVKRCECCHQSSENEQPNLQHVGPRYS